MPCLVKIRPRAALDIDDHAEYFARHANDGVARRFHQAVEETIANIAAFPELGSPWESDDTRVQKLRFRPLTRFKNHVLFYRVTDDSVEIVRLLHSAQDLEQYLE